MTRTFPSFALATSMLAGAVVVLAAGGAPQTPPQVQQPSVVELTISGEPGSPPRFAVPDFVALSNDGETVSVAQAIGQVLWDDLAFEREFYLIPRDTYRSIPSARGIADVPFDRWRELGADGVVAGTVQRTETGIQVQVRLYNVRSRASVFAKEYTGSAANPRLFAHTIADECTCSSAGSAAWRGRS
jgi:TolB protein